MRKPKTLHALLFWLPLVLASSFLASPAWVAAQGGWPTFAGLRLLRNY